MFRATIDGLAIGIMNERMGESNLVASFLLGLFRVLQHLAGVILFGDFV